MLTAPVQHPVYNSNLRVRGLLGEAPEAAGNESATARQGVRSKDES